MAGWYNSRTGLSSETGSQDPCSARHAVTAWQHFMLLCMYVVIYVCSHKTLLFIYFSVYIYCLYTYIYMLSALQLYMAGELCSRHLISKHAATPPSNGFYFILIQRHKKVHVDPGRLLSHCSKAKPKAQRRC